ncbi:MAG: hypothetical protein NT062_01820 [Proteobacteria bacterium]|nr:hypothetical protein [Pseudomonadota bacterium]
MKNLMIVFVAVASLAAVGCKKKAADAGAGSGSDTTMAAGSGSAASGSAGSGSAAVATAGGDCTKALANSMAVSKAEMTKMGVDDKMAQQITDLGVQHCTEDKWGPEAITCMTAAKTMAEAQGCYGKLTAEQVKRNTAAKALMPAAPAGSGSNAGSAGSGSSGSGSATK